MGSGCISIPTSFSYANFWVSLMILGVGGFILI